MNWKIKAIKILTGKIVVQTGLHIGGGDAGMEIGGMDNPIIRNPQNNLPYIPGSSLKGKMRSLLEWHYGKLNEKGNTHQCSTTEKALDCPVCRVFGISASKDIKAGPTRIIVRDCNLTEPDAKAMAAGKVIIEEKSENTINRITAMATPRPLERVVPGVAFDLNISYKILDMDDGGATDEKFFEDVVLTGLALVQMDFLGGGGSRGNGRVEFADLEVDGQSVVLPKVKFMEAAG